MKRLLIIITLFALCTCGVHGQCPVRDTLAFRQYFSENIGTRTDLQALMQLYHRLSATYTKAEREQVSSKLNPPGDAGGGSEIHWNDRGYITYVGFKDAGNWNAYPGYGRLDNFLFPDTLREPLMRNIYRYRYDYKQCATDKAALVEALRAFDSVAVHKPVFYADIYSTFKGDYKKYVDHLYKRSFLCNNQRMTLFARRPEKVKIQKDPGVQFVIGLALYELWIKDVREGCVAEVGNPERLSR